MDKYRPKRPTTLALFPQRAQPRSQDTINNNSLEKKDSWKDSRSSSPHITGDSTPSGAQQKGEDKVQLKTKRPAPKPPTAKGAGGKTNTHSHAAATTDTHTRPREKQMMGTAPTHSTRGMRFQRRGGGRGGGATGREAVAMREKTMGESRGRDGGVGVKEERRGGRLCEESSGKERERGRNQKYRETNGPKSRGDMGKGKVGARGGSRGGRDKPNAPLQNPNIYLTAMVVPRTPVVPKKQERTQDQDQNNDRTQNCPPMSQSSSEGGSNRMSLSSDTEGPPPGPLHPSFSNKTNPDISEEEGEGDPTPAMNSQKATAHCLEANDNSKTCCTGSDGRQVDSRGGGGKGGPDEDNKSEVHCANSVPKGGSLATFTAPTSEAAAGFNYDSLKYTLVVDEHYELELVKLKDCYHNYNKRDDDSDTETVYQSANEEEDPEYEEDMKMRDEEMRQGKRKDAFFAVSNLTLPCFLPQERRRAEEKRKREEAARFYRRPKVMSTTTSEEEESNRGRGGAPRTRKFLNLFVNNSSQYSSTGADLFGLFSCVLDGVERQQSHRAVYRFVPRHADELYLETDDPVLMLAQSEDLWCQGYNMRTGATGIFPAFYAVRVTKETSKAQKDGWIDRFLVRFMGSVQVPSHKGNDVLCAAMQKVACNRRLAMQPPSACVLEVSVKGLKISVHDQCNSAARGDQCFNFFQLKNISFCGCHPKYNKYFGFITKHPDQQRFACHVMMSDATLLPLAESVGRAFQQYYKEHVGYSCPTEDIFIE
ncbi:C-Jun-amino-terminal kinase-interacting protein 1-like [Lampris incognitus]|uniref:C-Jun-amino-terminal kinase-interacting protein 1-like n=1 Tax=Lampris incognitus TaxID=2546036 RepID=UPI0024B577AC|nr:C-Jun-amino-terminal kinase-interacting protein 1-like [Lampris incognitus]